LVFTYIKMQECIKLADEMDRATVEPEEMVLYKNFAITDADSPLGDLRKLIHEHGYGTFLETTKDTPAWNKACTLQESLVRMQNDMEINMVFAALALMTKEEIEAWQIKLSII
jgi:hypothetical protein